MPALATGQASPGTGTTATVFTFSVTYSDTKGCAPNWVRVTIAGVGIYQMTGNGPPTYDSGVTFTGSMQLPVGTYAYSFTANSGDPGAEKTTLLATVDPASVTVTAIVTQPPVPTATPVPTPKPTPVPKPVPTPAPTVAPTASATPSASPPAGPGGQTPAPSLDPGANGAASEGAAASQDQAGAPGPSPSNDGAAAGFAKTEPLGSLPLLLGGWATATAGGLALFLYLAPRRRREQEPVLAAAGSGDVEPQEPAADTAPETPAPTSALVPPDEVNMPRWLRPSVQAARQGRGPRSNVRRAEDS